MHHDETRQEIRHRLAMGEASLLDRVGETAIEAKDRVTAFVREHPLTTIGAALAIGVLISGLFERSPTRRAGRKAAGLATVGAEAVVAFLHEALESAGDAANSAGRTAGELGRAGAHRAEDLGGTLADTMRSLRHDAADALDSAGDSFDATQRGARKSLRRSLGSWGRV